MEHPLIVVLIILILVGVVPTIPRIIRKWDFKRQVEGKRPERQLKEGDKISYDKPGTSNGEADVIGKASVTAMRMNWRNTNV